MAHLLHIDSSAFASGSVSKDIATTYRKAWQEAHPDGTIEYRDLGANPVDPLSEAGITSGFAPADERTPEQVTARAYREALVEQVVAADAYLFGVPMYNWAIPSTFKAWLDQILVTGVTFSFGEDRPLAGRPATLVLSYGGGYGPGTPREGWDHVQPYLEHVLDTVLGLDLTIVKAQLTLAERNPAMAALIPASRQELEAAHALADSHARTVAERLSA